MISTFILALIACLLVLAWLHSMDRTDGMPTRRQRRLWQRERADLNPTWNRWR